MRDYLRLEDLKQSPRTYCFEEKCTDKHLPAATRKPNSKVRLRYVTGLSRSRKYRTRQCRKDWKPLINPVATMQFFFIVITRDRPLLASPQKTNKSGRLSGFEIRGLQEMMRSNRTLLPQKPKRRSGHKYSRQVLIIFPQLTHSHRMREMRIK